MRVNKISTLVLKPFIHSDSLKLTDKYNAIAGAYVIRIHCTL